MTRPLFYDIKLFNIEHPEISYTTQPQPVNEFRSKQDIIPRKVTVDDVQYDILNDLTTKGSDKIPKGILGIEVACIDRDQYIGMARSDLFIRMPDRRFG